MAVSELVINRAKWGERHLLNSDGTMCCLGFLSKACGVDDSLLLGKGFPLVEWTTKYGVNTEFTRPPSSNPLVASIAASINDGALYTKSEKEAQLITLFADNGITLSFTGEHRSE